MLHGDIESKMDDFSDFGGGADGMVGARRSSRSAAPSNSFFEVGEGKRREGKYCGICRAIFLSRVANLNDADRRSNQMQGVLIMD